MADGTQLSMTDEGRLAVTKRAAAGPGAAALRREADALARATHPGVVELLAAEELDGGLALHTAFVGGGTLAEHLGTLAPSRGAHLAAALAATVADLHARGVAHQRLTADHVLVTDADHVRLCGFGGAAVGPEGQPIRADVAAVDVEAVALLVADIAGALTNADAPPLRAVADRVLRADPAARPAMSTLAQALADLTAGEAAPDPVTAPGPRVLAARSPAAGGRPRPGRRHVAMGALVTTAILALVVAAAVVTGRPDGGGPTPTAMDDPDPRLTPAPVAAPTEPPPPANRSAPSSSPPIERAPVRVWPPGPPPAAAAGGQCPSPAPRAGADVDGDGCPEAVEVGDGVVTVADRRWQVAAAGDVVAVGDWDCDGTATPAVVRPATGDVWVYDRWAEATEAVAAEPAGAVPGAVSAQSVDDEHAACDVLHVVDANGQSTRLPVG